MPYKDPAKARAYQAMWQREKRKRLTPLEREKRRLAKRRAAKLHPENPEKKRERNLRWVKRNPDANWKKNKRWRVKNRGRYLAGRSALYLKWNYGDLAGSVISLRELRREIKNAK